MRFRPRVATTAFVAAGVLAACQAVSGLGDLNKVDCLTCEGGTDDAPPPCTHTFCAAFDQSPVQAGWKAIAQSSGAKVELDNVETKSPPASLLTTVPSNELGGVEATLSQTFPLPLKGFHLELDVRVQPGVFPDAGTTIVDAALADGDADDGDSGIGPIADGSSDAEAEGGIDAGPVGPVSGGIVKLVTFAAADAPDVSIALAWTATGPIVLVTTPGNAGTEVALPLSKSPPANTWARVRLDVIFDANGKGSVKAQIDGAPVLDKSDLSIIGAGAPGSQLTVGLVTRDRTPEFKVNYDNVTLDIDP